VLWQVWGTDTHQNAVFNIRQNSKHNIITGYIQKLKSSKSHIYNTRSTVV